MSHGSGPPVSLDCHDLKSTKEALATFVHSHDHNHLHPPAIWEVWGIGLLMVTVTAFSASIGIKFLPMLSKKAARRVLTIMGGLGAGALSGTTMFVMFPEAFHITKLGSTDYPFKAWLVAAGIYMLFVIDKLFKFFIEFSKKPEVKEQ